MGIRRERRHCRCSAREIFTRWVLFLLDSQCDPNSSSRLSVLNLPFTSGPCFQPQLASVYPSLRSLLRSISFKYVVAKIERYPPLLFIEFLTWMVQYSFALIAAVCFSVGTFLMSEAGTRVAELPKLEGQQSFPLCGLSPWVLRHSVISLSLSQVYSWSQRAPGDYLSRY